MALTASAKRIDITPDSPATLGCGPSKTALVSDIAEPLEANIAILQDDDTPPLILISIDTLYVGGYMDSIIRQEVKQTHPEAQIYIFASHTHRAPMIDDSKPELGLISKTYRDFVRKKLSTEIRTLLTQTELVPVTLTVAESAGPFSINRRRKEAGHIVLAPNPLGVTDDSITVLAAHSSEGAVFVFWSMACHPVAHPLETAISAHYPGIVRDIVRSHWASPEVPVVFAQGFSADTRPYPSAAVASPKQLLQKLVNRPRFHDMSLEVYKKWTRAIGESVVKALEDRVDIPSLSPMVHASNSYKLRDFVIGPSSSQEVNFRGTTISNRLSILSIEAEVPAEVALEIRKRYPEHRFLFAGCEGNTFGYAASKPLFDGGGYEVSGFCRSFGFSGASKSMPAALAEGIEITLRQLFRGSEKNGAR